MDKELLDKVNKVLKANGKRELSMDELAKVCGGGYDWISNGDGTITLNGTRVGPDDINPIFLELANTYGFSVAYNRFVALFGAANMDAVYPGAMTLGGTDAEKMGIVLAHFWKVVA